MLATDTCQISFEKQINNQIHNYIIFIDSELKLHQKFHELDSKSGNIISKFLKSIDPKTQDKFKADYGQAKSLTFFDNNEHIHHIALVGLGQEEKLTKLKLEELGAKIFLLCERMKFESAALLLAELNTFSTQETAVYISTGLHLASYKFDKYHTNPKDKIHHLKKAEIILDNHEKAAKEFEIQNHINAAVFLSRNCGNEPANILNTDSYEKLITETFKNTLVEVEVLNEPELKKLGMNAILAVGQGSSFESKLIIMKYNGASKETTPIAFVGKGVMFDTGGISLKPANNMDEMKSDMCGSAAVFGAIKALESRKAKVNAIGVIAVVENMPGANAQRPGDIITTLSGQTVEVLNTDAEGRLILADALWYTQDKFKPQIIIDLATLTGAILVALGGTYAGCFSNNDELVAKLEKASQDVGEKIWRMPLHEDYDKVIKSGIADIANIGGIRGLAGSSTAAQFLQKFVNNVPWIHLDIAGVATTRASGKGNVTATGFGVRLLDSLVKHYYEQN